MDDVAVAGRCLLNVVFPVRGYILSRFCLLWKPLALVQERLEPIAFGSVEFLDVALKRGPVFVPLVFAARTIRLTTGIFNTVTEPLPTVYIHMAASSSSDVNQLPRTSVYLLLAVWGIEVLLGPGPDQLESFVAFFTFPRVELHFTDAVFHIETIILSEITRSI